jgi:hypothetical protein
VSTSGVGADHPNRRADPPRAERERLTAAGATWLDTPVTVEERDAELPLTDHATQAHVHNRPLDPDELARAVTTQLN